MIIDKVKLADAFKRLSDYYNKIIFVDINSDAFELCKIETDELDDLKTESFSSWIADFTLSPLLHNYDRGPFMKFMDNLLAGYYCNVPATIYYQKKIKEEWHDVFLEAVPLGNDKYYILVKDFSLMEG